MEVTLLASPHHGSLDASGGHHRVADHAYGDGPAPLPLPTAALVRALCHDLHVGLGPLRGPSWTASWTPQAKSTIVSRNMSTVTCRPIRICSQGWPARHCVCALRSLAMHRTMVACIHTNVEEELCSRAYQPKKLSSNTFAL